MALINGYQCPRCLSPHTEPAESGGRICLGCGHWF